MFEDADLVIDHGNEVGCITFTAPISSPRRFHSPEPEDWNPFPTF